MASSHCSSRRASSPRISCAAALLGSSLELFQKFLLGPGCGFRPGIWPRKQQPAEQEMKAGGIGILFRSFLHIQAARAATSLASRGLRRSTYGRQWIAERCDQGPGLLASIGPSRHGQARKEHRDHGNCLLSSRMKSTVDSRSSTAKAQRTPTTPAFFLSQQGLAGIARFSAEMFSLQCPCSAKVIFFRRQPRMLSGAAFDCREATQLGQNHKKGPRRAIIEHLDVDYTS